MYQSQRQLENVAIYQAAHYYAYANCCKLCPYYTLLDCDTHSLPFPRYSIISVLLEVAILTAAVVLSVVRLMLKIISQLASLLVELRRHNFDI